MKVRPEVNEQDLRENINDAIFEAYREEENKYKEMDDELNNKIVDTITKMLFEEYFYKEEE